MFHVEHLPTTGTFMNQNDDQKFFTDAKSELAELKARIEKLEKQLNDED